MTSTQVSPGPDARLAQSAAETPAAQLLANAGVAQSRVAILIPCFNEELTVAKVVDDFRAQLPEARIYVFDNRSSDATARIALDHGAIVLPEPRRGKGYVVASMFQRVEADYYVMADGDDTYPAEHLGRLLAPVVAGTADMVVGTRLQVYTDQSFRPLHVLGNHLVRWLLNRIFNARLKDILSGYRVFSRRVAKSIPIVSSGFEVETEMTANALDARFEIAELPIPYRERPAGSFSKLSTFSDGARVLWKLFSLFRAYKPLTFFGVISLVLLALGLWSGAGPVADYMATGQVARFPRAILATGFVLLSAGTFFSGLLLHALNWRIKELQSLVVRQA